MIDERGARMLAPDECYELLAEAASETVGRIALNDVPSPHVIPVNFTIADRRILVRLGPGWTAFHLDHAECTLEVDHVGSPRQKGWSVVVLGTAGIVTFDEVARLGTHLPSPSVPRPGVWVFEIIPSEVTGRCLDSQL
jgi:hypothetical protein